MRAQEVNVELAAGTAVLRLLPWTKTLLTKEEVQMIVPLGVLISLGYEAVWEKSRFELTDPAGITLDTRIENSCPTISEELAMELIQEIERSMVRERARLAFLAGEEVGLEVSAQEANHLEELKDLLPQVPHHLLERLLPKKGWTGEGLPWNRHERRRIRKAREVVIHLFSGDSKQFWQKELEAESRVVLCVDTVINPAMNLLRDDVFAYLLDIADSGTLCALLGGPPCRTMSRLRYRQPGPPPLREREGPHRFGLPQLDRYLQKQVEDALPVPSGGNSKEVPGDPLGLGAARGPRGVHQGRREEAAALCLLLELAGVEKLQREMEYDGGLLRPRPHGSPAEETYATGNEHPEVGGTPRHSRTRDRGRSGVGGGPDGAYQAESDLVGMGTWS